MPGIVALFLVAIIAYLWGSLPSGYWMGKILRGKDFDIREYGSRKTGATNVLRTLGRFPAAIVFLLDISKGIGPALLATFVPFFQVSGWGPLVVGMAAFIGHCYPVFIGFKGGRGVLTGAGAMLIFSPLTFLIAAITCFTTIGISRYVSLGSIVGCLTTMICGVAFYFMGQANSAFIGRVTFAQFIFLVLAPAAVIFLHSDNISRLLSGKERKIGQKEVLPA